VHTLFGSIGKLHLEGLSVGALEAKELVTHTPFVLLASIESDGNGLTNRPAPQIAA
jgi:hypothetical protein